MRKAILILTAIVAVAAISSCDPGDGGAPGKPRNFRFICNADTGASDCLVPNTRILKWTASGDDGDEGRAIEYDIRYDRKAIEDEGDFEDAKKMLNEPQPEDSGSHEQVFLPRYLPGREISFGIRAIDEVSRQSGVATTPLVTLGFVGVPFKFYRQCGDSIDNDGDTFIDDLDPQCDSDLDGSEADAAPGAIDPMFGYVVTSLGDVSDTDRRDVAAGAPGAASPLAAGVDTGSVSLYFALARKRLIVKKNGFRRAAAFARPAVVIYGEASGDMFGATIAGEGDFNDDKVKDFAVGAPGAGKVYVFFGGSSGRLNYRKLNRNPNVPAEYSADAIADVIITGPAGVGFGSSIEFTGSMDKSDGSELAIGAPDEDRVYLFYGGFHAANVLDNNDVLPVTIDLGAGALADWTLEGPVGSEFGAAISRITDLDEQGRDEMAVGAPGIDSVFVFYSGMRTDKALDFNLPTPQTWTYDGSNFDLIFQGNVGSRFGASIARRGVPTGKDYGSIAIGAPDEDKVYVVHGGNQGFLNFPVPSPKLHDVITNGADMVFEGDAGTGFGTSISIRPDLDDDTRSDTLIGAPLATRPDALQTGAVYAFENNKNSKITRSAAEAKTVIWGGVDGGLFGSSLAGLYEQVPHVNFTYREFDDFVAGSPGENEAYIEF